MASLTRRREDYGPGWRFPSGRNDIPPRVAAGMDVALGVLSGWNLSNGGRDVILGLWLLTVMAASILSPPRLQVRVILAAMVALTAVLLVVRLVVAAND